MDLTVPVSTAERAAARLDPETERAALATLHAHGCVLLRGAFDVETIDSLYRAFTNRTGALDAAAMAARSAQPAPNPILEVGPARYELTIAMTGPFADPALFANPMLIDLLARPLGGDLRLSSLTVVVSHPGAEQQHTHRDHPYIFGDQTIAAPVYAINVALPLIDIDAVTGPTGIWPGSHRWPEGVIPPPDSAYSCDFQRGDAIVMDYRTAHTGLPNRSSRARPILYLVYARPWFFDDLNHQHRIPLDMPLDAYEKIPPEHRPLLSRAHSDQLRARWFSSSTR